MAGTGRSGESESNLSDMSLRELIQHHIDRGLSAREIARRGGITHPTVTKWQKQSDTNRIEESTITALALGMGLSRNLVYKAALQIPARPPFELPARAAQLNDRERKAVLAVVGALLDKEQGRGSGESGGPTPIRPVRPGPQPVLPVPERAAARRAKSTE